MKKVFFLALALVILAGCTAAPVATPPSNTPVPDIAVEAEPVPGMVYVPAGEFQMGCDPNHNGGFSCAADELPLHTVLLDGFYIDQYEVTNAQYAECVKAGACETPSTNSSDTRESYYDNPTFTDYPVIKISWNDADSYCNWAGKSLPSEAQWEKASRGTDTRTYSWGDGEPNCTLSNLYDIGTSTKCVGDTSAVGNYPDSASPYGALDMTGNVWEWVSDWYSETYYQTSPNKNPTGPSGETYKVLRGGSWSSNWLFSRTAGRSYDPAFNTSDDVGFRCVLSN